MKLKIPLPQLLKKLWETWDVRFIIILSLSLQAFLVLFVPLRKRFRTYWIFIPIWSAYLMADWAANFSVGQISNSQSNRIGNIKKGDHNADILAFWAPFLLVHLGGPDTITAFSLEDNELWIRHFLGLIFQAGAAVYIFYQSFPKNQLWLPTIFMFISGTIKYGERTRSLFLASLNRFRDSLLDPPDPGPNYAKIMNEYTWKREANLPTRIKQIPEPPRGNKAVNRVKTGKLTDIEVVLHAHKFFETFKGLIVDLIFSLRQRNQTRDFFLERTPTDAFKVVETELNFIYDVLFTKVSVVYTKFGYFFRLISISLVVTSLGLFYCEDKSNFENPDVAITYTLLLGAIALDVIAFIQHLTSIWLIVAIKRLPLINQDSQESDAEQTSQKSNYGCIGRIMQVLGRRWSESLSSYNLIDYCLLARGSVKEKLINLLGLTGILDEWKYVKQKSFEKELRDHIFKELKMKSKMADDLDTAKEISAARGDWILRVEGCSDLHRFVTEVNYDESLLLWHIATELCYVSEKNNDANNHADNSFREFSKVLSDYMIYLLVMQPKVMSAVTGIGLIRFRDTCAEAKKFFTYWREKSTKHSYSRDKRDACMSLLKVNTETEPVEIKGDRSKSVLFDGCKLAKKLQDLDKDEDKDKWEIISKVWVEMMCYAAIHCRANTHAQLLSRGGELVTIVWLLMAHFGLCDRFQINQGHNRAKLIVEK